MTRLDQMLRYSLEHTVPVAHGEYVSYADALAVLEEKDARIKKLEADLTKVRREAKWAMEWIDGRIYGQKIWHASKDPDYQRAKAFLSQPEIQALEEQP